MRKAESFLFLENHRFIFGYIQYAISVDKIPKPAPATTSPTQCLLLSALYTPVKMAIG